MDVVRLCNSGPRQWAKTGRRQKGIPIPGSWAVFIVVITLVEVTEVEAVYSTSRLQKYCYVKYDRHGP